MVKNETQRLPKLGRHSTGQGRVCLSGRTYYLGDFGTIECQRRYTELVERWIANGRRSLDPAATCEQTRRVRDLCAAYLAWLDATGRYHQDGKPTDQRKVCKLALDEFTAKFGDVPAGKLTAVHVRQHRDALETRVHLTRGGINKKVAHLRMGLRWARERGMLTRDQWLDISEIRPLSRHECGGRDHKQAKRAVTPEDIEKVARESPPQVARMLRVQAAVGMRPGEVCAMRWCDLSTETVDVDGVPCVIYTVARAKSDRHGKPTTYALPPSILALLGMATAPGAPVFPSPAREGKGYYRHAYRNAVARACVRAGVEHFGPHQLRHSFLTRAAQRFGVLAASAAANHADTRVTASYLHANKLDGYRCVVGLSSEAATATG